MTDHKNHATAAAAPTNPLTAFIAAAPVLAVGATEPVAVPEEEDLEDVRVLTPIEDCNPVAEVLTVAVEVMTVRTPPDADAEAFELCEAEAEASEEIDDEAEAEELALAVPVRMICD